jgi:zinc protease
MTRMWILAIIAITFALIFSGSLHAENRIKELSEVSDIPYVQPRLTKFTLSNGMLCYLLEDHSLPIVEGKLMIKGGNIYEGRKEYGVSGLMTGSLKDGGTSKRSAQELRKYLDENAIDISFGSGQESFEGYFGSLSRDADKAMAIFFETLFEPAFAEDGLATVRKRLADGLQRELELSGPLSHVEFVKMLYGGKNPWGKYPTPSDVKGLDRKDVVAFYDRFFSPDRMILAMAGDFSASKVKKRLEELLRPYPRKDLPPLVVPKVEESDKPEEKVISRDFTQAAISVGHLGASRDNPDRFAIVIFNDVLGGSGSFANRLMDSVRVKGGLAYEVWSKFTFGPAGVPGVFEAHAKTRNKTISRAIEEIKTEIQKIHDGGITRDELSRSKKGILSKLIFQFERPFSIVTSVARYVLMGFPENYVEVYRRGVQKASLEDVNSAAKKYLHPDKLKIVIAGKYARD